ncbi:NupC/NupG family nucleoside CNT transporter [Flavobacteriales bacterium]|nr:NupC/NupG family nucleoside CNT transporter [Flavobacteriales bacterium]
MSVVGMAVLLGLAYAFSRNRSAIAWRTVAGAFALQFGLGAFVLRVPWGQSLLSSLTEGVNGLLNYANEGISFLFGEIVGDSIGFTFAFKVLPIIVFFASLIAVLYHVGIMKWVIRIIGGALQRVLGTSKAESMSATANIFVGQTEAPLVVKPYIASMTQSELFAVMVGGLASVAGSALGGYAMIGVPVDYLIAACFMSAPGGLLFAKMLMPETEEPKAELPDQADDEAPVNVIDAAAGGASSGLQLALNVGAMLLAFVALIALLNGVLGGIGAWVGRPDLTLELMLGWAFSPLAFLLGVPWSEAVTAGSFIGQKLVVNEFVAYLNLAPYLVEGAVGALSPKTAAIVSFALCGFANLSSIAILLGGLGGMAPARRKDIAKFGLLAVMAGTMSNLMSGTIAGLFVALG